MCPASIATGGTEGIHNLVRELNRCGANAKIWYVNENMARPQPKEYASYGCEWTIRFPTAFNGCIIFPEVWANRVTEHWNNCSTAVNWQGVDVYDWHTPRNKRGLFLKNRNTVHIANSEYAMAYLKRLEIRPVKISDCLNDAFYEQILDDSVERNDTVLYNPTELKLTAFQKIVMQECAERFKIKFLPLRGYTRDQLINLFSHAKLYIDFGVFSGRERLPREAVMCGCCILTSRLGTAGIYKDNQIPDQYKIGDVDTAVRMVYDVLKHYEKHAPNFDEYRQALRTDKEEYPNEVKRLYNEILNHYTGV